MKLNKKKIVSIIAKLMRSHKKTTVPRSEEIVAIEGRIQFFRDVEITSHSPTVINDEVVRRLQIISKLDQDDDQIE